MIDVAHIRALANEAILQIRMGCQAYRTGDLLSGELHMSLGQAALLKLHALLDEPAQKPIRRLVVVGPREEELPEWMTKKHGGNDGDAA